MQSNYNAIDLMKFIMALFVVIVHVEPLMTISPTFTYLFDKVIVRASVPFFFLAAGFFLYRKMNFDSLNLSIIGSYILRIFRVYLVWTILYLPLILYKLPNDLQSVKDIAKFLLREFFMIGSYAQLWFLPALIMAVIFVTCLIKLQIKFKYIFIITGGLYILGLLDQSYYGFFKEFWSDESGKLYKILDYLQAIFGTTRNGFTFGALYVAIGAYIAFNNVKISIKRAFIGNVIFAILFVAVFVFQIAIIADEAEKEQLRYNNTVRTDTSFSITSTETANVLVSYIGVPNITTGATIEITIKNFKFQVFMRQNL